MAEFSMIEKFGCQAMLLASRKLAGRNNAFMPDIPEAQASD